MSAAPESLRTDIDIVQLRERLQQLGLLTEISYHAGTFVCNEIYFKALEKWSSNHDCKGILFTHLPAADNYLLAKSASVNGTPAQTDAIEDYSLTLQETIRFICG